MPASLESEQLSTEVRLLKTIAEFDSSDAYHDGDRPIFAGDAYSIGYYDALDRVGWLLRGEITDWTSPRPAQAGVVDPFTST